MSGLSPSSNTQHFPNIGRRAEPVTLDTGHLTSADGVGERLRAELAGVVSALPPDARAVSAMTRHLGLDRSICQRVVGAATFKGPGRAVLARVPGVAGLMSFVRAARRKGVDAGWVSGAEVAATRFADLLRDLNLSQAGLVRALAASEGGRNGDGPAEGGAGAGSSTGIGVGTAAGGAGPVGRRQRLMVDAADLTGTATDLNIVMAAYRPSPADPRRLEAGYLRGFIGYRARADGMPLVVAWGSAMVDAGRDLLAIDGSTALGHAPQALLTDYCSRPLPTITGRDSASARVFVIDPAAAGTGGSADVVIASRSPNSMPHPMLDEPPMIEVWGQTQVPGRNVLLDVWLHDSLARQGVPSVGEYLATPAIAAGKGRDWTRRLPGSPRLELLGRGTAQAHSGLYDRQAALCGDFFRALGWAESEMVGFRCEHAAPVFGSALCVAFEFPRESGQATGDTGRSAG
jgi:hypothetical protein